MCGCVCGNQNVPPSRSVSARSGILLLCGIFRITGDFHSIFFSFQFSFFFISFVRHFRFVVQRNCQISGRIVVGGKRSGTGSWAALNWLAFQVRGYADRVSSTSAHSLTQTHWNTSAAWGVDSLGRKTTNALTIILIRFCTFYFALNQAAHRTRVEWFAHDECDTMKLCVNIIIILFRPRQSEWKMFWNDSRRTCVYVLLFVG